MTGAASRYATPPYRRRQGVARRRRSRLLRWLAKPWLRLLLVACVLLGTATWLTHSPALALRRLAVEGTSQVPQSWIQETLDPYMGTNLLLLPFAEIESTLAAHRWIRAVGVTKRLPDRLEVQVLEHQPAAVLESGDAFHLVSREGEVFTPFVPPQEGIGLLLLRYGEAGWSGGVPPGSALQPALELAHRLAEGHPQWGRELTEIEILGEGDYQLRIRPLPFPVLVSRRSMDEKIRILSQLLPELLRRYPSLEKVDLRFSRRIIIAPTRDRGAVSKAG